MSCSATSESMNLWYGAVSPHPPILLPEVGRGQEQDAAATRDGMRTLASRIAAIRPRLLICVTPHGPAYRSSLRIQEGAQMTGDMGQFGAPECRLSVPLDPAAATAVGDALREAGLPVLTETLPARLDHGCMVPLYFLREAMTLPPIVHITSSLQDPAVHMAAGAAIRTAVAGLPGPAVLLASADLSHVLARTGPYGFHPSGPVFDRRVAEILRTGKWDHLTRLDPVMVEEAAQCGLRPLCTLAGYLGFAESERPAPESAAAEVFSHEGPFGVGYLTALVQVPGASGARQENGGRL